MGNKKRLIDANALKRTIRAESWVRKQIVHLTLEFINLMIDEQPTVDAVEVVRCKDCKHLNVLNRKDLYAHCPKTNTVFFPFELDARTHFCSLGERKENA